MRFFTIFALFNACWAAYITWRLVGRLRSHPFRAGIIMTAIYAVLGLTPLSMLIRRAGWSGAFIDALTWIGHLGLAFFSFHLAFLLAGDVLQISRKIKEILKTAMALGQEKPPLCPGIENPQRRQFLLNGMNGGMLAGSFTLTGYGLSEARRTPRVKEVDIPIARLPKELDGFRVVQITDLHVGPTLGRSFVEAVVREVNALKADIVALTGDLVDGPVDQLSDAVAPLESITAQDGKFFVTGNHEYYSGALAWIEKVKTLGFTVLLNDFRLIRRRSRTIVLAGVTDLYGGSFFIDHRSDPKGALRGAPDGDIRILLAHQPKNIFEAAEAGYDLQISGHTHGGQFFPWILCVGLFQPYVAGLYTHERTRLYVSRGTGYWGPPVRVGSPSEITLIRLRAAPRAGAPVES